MSSYADFLGFDPHQTESAESFEGSRQAIPEGEYQVIASAANKKNTKKKDGWFWAVVFTVIEGEYKGKTVSHYFNMDNPSVDAVAIGRSQMRRFLEAVGNLEPKNENDFLNIALRIHVKCEKNTYTNRKGEQVEGWNNKITKIDPICADKKPAVDGINADRPW